MVENEDEEEVVGIDLGTSSSKVAMFVDDDLVVLENDLFKRSTPSCATVPSNDSSLDWVVGEAALMQAVVYPELTMQGTKQLLGNPCQSDPTLQQAIVEIMKHLVAIPQGKTVVSAAISVPAYFNQMQRKSYLDAGTLYELNEYFEYNDCKNICFEFMGLTNCHFKAFVIFGYYSF
ncbi:chaperone protein DnaK-like [Thrips palmi]|uniref:Chaperone protein DnaK-like n=1 Tax=Thrips palmi TaxID=161013 RepID=A0A6P8Z9Z7_THRPL|nr:chaperone protein DnaK-like [Thrips palmi]